MSVADSSADTHDEGERDRVQRRTVRRRPPPPALERRECATGSPRLAGAGGGVTAGFVARATTYATLCLAAVMAALALVIFLPRRRIV